MTIGIVGGKSGMTRISTDDGISIPVTVLEVSPNRVTPIKNLAAGGYEAIQVTVGEKRSSRVNKPVKGHFAKAEALAGRGLWEFRGEAGDIKVGSALTLEAFEADKIVDVTGTYCDRHH